MRYVGIGLVHGYRFTLGRFVPAGTCKYHPSCSQYATDALAKHGPLRGSLKIAWRLLRCNPWSDGGVDKLEDRRLFRGTPTRSERQARTSLPPPGGSGGARLT